MKYRLLIVVLLLISLIVYLFATAPPPLPEANEQSGGRKIAVTEAFRLLAQENDALRTLYTKKIVGDGQKAGLRFDEDWRLSGVEAGPLPALFLRATASYLERDPLPLSLFLGSDFPISEGNKFSGLQQQYFTQIKEDGEPRFFFDESTQRYTAMFADLASAPACVSCHNQHPNSPKRDWQLGDVMGATTWSFPRDSVSTDEMVALLSAYRAGARHTYQSYLDEAKLHKEVPVIGEQWPAQGFYLPEAQVFMDSASRRISAKTLDQLLTYLQQDEH